MPLSKELTTKFSLLKKRLDDYRGEYESGDLEAAEEEGYEASRDNDEKFVAILKDACTLIREAESSEAADFPEILEAAQDILNQAVSFAYSDVELFEFLPSWAHDNDREEPLIEDLGETELPFLCE